MRVVDPKNRPRPFIGPRTHARLRHDYATWHPKHAKEALDTSSNRLPFEDRSKFDSFQIIEDAIARSEKYVAHTRDEPGKNFVITFDMGHHVGYDAHARRRASAVTIILSPIGEVITVHPGTPWSQDWGEA